MRDYDGRIETEDREITSSLAKRQKTIEDLNSTVFLWIIDCEVLIMYDCGFTKENNWF